MHPGSGMGVVVCFIVNGLCLRVMGRNMACYPYLPVHLHCRFRPVSLCILQKASNLLPSISTISTSSRIARLSLSQRRIFFPSFVLASPVFIEPHKKFSVSSSSAYIPPLTHINYSPQAFSSFPFALSSHTVPCIKQYH